MPNNVFLLHSSNNIEAGPLLVESEEGGIVLDFLYGWIPSKGMFLYIKCLFFSESSKSFL